MEEIKDNPKLYEKKKTKNISRFWWQSIWFVIFGESKFEFHNFVFNSLMATVSSFQMAPNEEFQYNAD